VIRALAALLFVGCAAQAVVPPVNVASGPPSSIKPAPAATVRPRSVPAPQGSGVIAGTLRDKQTGDPVVGATVVALSPALQGEQVVISGDTGLYEIVGLPAGRYTLTIYYNDYIFHRSYVPVVNRNTTRRDIRLDEEAAHRVWLARIAAAQRKAQARRSRHP